MGRAACTDPQCLYSTAIPLLPYGPYGLYRASVPVQYSYTSTPLWTVQPVQSLSACTVDLYLYPSMDRTSVQSRSACTRVHFTILPYLAFKYDHWYNKHHDSHIRHNSSVLSRI